MYDLNNSNCNNSYQQKIHGGNVFIKSIIKPANNSVIKPIGNFLQNLSIIEKIGSPITIVMGGILLSVLSVMLFCEFNKKSKLCNLLYTNKLY
jgi:hypothetical protein